MEVERLRPTVLRVTLHAYEMATLIATARWVAEGAEGELPESIGDDLGAVLARYDRALERATEAKDEPSPS